MWRVVALTLVVLTALYNIILYAGILQHIINANTQATDHVSPRQIPKNALRTFSTYTTTGGIKFFLIPTPEITTNLLLKQNASIYYQSSLNEESAEVWLHRGFERMASHQTKDPAKADIFLISGYLHLGRLNDKAKDYAMFLQKRIHNKTKPHVVLCPTWNPQTSRQSGIAHLIKQLETLGVNVWSVGFERNPSWQMVNASRIIPVPYVVRPSIPREELIQKARSRRQQDFVFYAGDARKNALEWAGCNRSMVIPLEHETNMDVSIRTPRNRLSQEEYNARMFTSDYCLILCGDTVTSRSLTSAVVYGCIPVRVGSRLRGLCELPCHKGWGWEVTGQDYPHLPFPTFMDWQGYPEVDEKDFSDAPLATLQRMFQSISALHKTRIRDNMLSHQVGWIYGWGDPITSNDFGEVFEYVWKSIMDAVGLQ